MTVDALFQRIVALRNTIEGITISGGEPLQQCRALLSLLRRVRRGTRLSVLVFSGYAWDEVRRMSDANALLDCIDVLIAGRYDQTQRLARDLRGSANKTVHLLTNRYTMDDLHSTPTAEVIITAEGDVVVSGIEPVRW